MKINDQKYAVEPLDKVQPHPNNPNKGVTLDIATSIEANGFYGAIVAQKSTGYILAGEHRWRAAKDDQESRRNSAPESPVEETQIPVMWVDVDDATALRILLVDNESTRKGSYDQEKLQEILDGLEELDGTGFEELAGATKTAPKDQKEEVHEYEYGVVALCDNEEHQKTVYDELLTLGLKLRLVVV